MTVSTIPYPERIRKLRTEQGLSKAEVARRAGLTWKSYYKIETAQADPNYVAIGTLRRIADALGVELADLL